MKTADLSSCSAEGAVDLYGSSDQGSEPTPVFLFMGKTGAGKSSMIKLLGGKSLDGDEPTVDGGLESCTFKSCRYQAEINNKKILLLDTPGFDDSKRENIEILREIASHLHVFALHKSSFEVRGVVFLHDIGETRLGGSQKTTWNILKEICGEKAMESNVFIGTTMWSPPGSKKLLKQEAREVELKREHWGKIYKTARVEHGNRDNAVQIISGLLSRPSILLQVQKQMMEPPHTIENTAAGRVARPEGEAERDQAREEYEAGQKRIKEEARQREEDLRRKQEEHIQKLEAEKRRQLEAAKKQEEEQRMEQLRHEEERRRKEEIRRKRYEEEQRRISEEAEENRRRAEEESRRRWEEQRKRQEEETRKMEEEFKRRAEEAEKRAEERRKQWEDDIRRRREEQEYLQRKIDEENRKKNEGGCCIQ